jgi:hypothetical protein
MQLASCSAEIQMAPSCSLKDVLGDIPEAVSSWSIQDVLPRRSSPVISSVRGGVARGRNHREAIRSPTLLTHIIVCQVKEI